MKLLEAMLLAETSGENAGHSFIEHSLMTTILSKQNEKPEELVGYLKSIANPGNFGRELNDSELARFSNLKFSPTDNTVNPINRQANIKDNAKKIKPYAITTNKASFLNSFVNKVYTDCISKIPKNSVLIRNDMALSYLISIVRNAGARYWQIAMEDKTIPKTNTPDAATNMDNELKRIIAMAANRGLFID